MDEIVKTEIEAAAMFFDGAISSVVPIPIAQIVLKLIDGYSKYRNQEFLCKLEEFLVPLCKLSGKQQKKCKKFVDKKIVGTKNEQKNGLLILEIIDDYDDYRKAGLLGRILKEVLTSVDEDVSAGKRSLFFKVAYIIKRCFYEDLDSLKLFNDGQIHYSSEERILSDLYKYGLLENVGIDGGDLSGDKEGYMYIMNEYGEIVLRSL